MKCPKCGKELKGGLAMHLKTHKDQTVETPVITPDIP
jgi:PHP family Zn ribbon phosphoesterase